METAPEIVPPSPSRTKFYLALTFAACLLLTLWVLGGRYLDIQYLRAHLHEIRNLDRTYPWWTFSGYAVLYLTVSAFAIPGAAPLTLLGGFLFGLVNGTILISLTSTVGSTLAFAISRYFFKSPLEKQYGRKAKILKAKIERYGAHYLFFLRLNPVIPFFMINTLMGVTNMRTWTFLWVSFVGMLPATIIFVNAGTQLSHIETPSDLLSPAVLISLTLLGLLPLIIQKIYEKRQRF